MIHKREKKSKLNSFLLNLISFLVDDGKSL